jgi:hypothetical protein
MLLTVIELQEVNELLAVGDAACGLSLTAVSHAMRFSDRQFLHRCRCSCNPILQQLGRKKKKKMAKTAALLLFATLLALTSTFPEVRVRNLLGMMHS